MTEEISVEVNGEVYNISRYEFSKTDDIVVYNFKTTINGEEHGMSAVYSESLAEELRDDHNINLSKELNAILIREFELEIAKILKENK